LKSENGQKDQPETHEEKEKAILLVDLVLYFGHSEEIITKSNNYIKFDLGIPSIGSHNISF
jgi:hypothetical protein